MEMSYYGRIFYFIFTIYTFKSDFDHKLVMMGEDTRRGEG